MTAPELKMCGVCNVGLNYVTGPEGITYRHPVLGSYDHEPVPVPTDLAKLRPVCDFCSSDAKHGYAYPCEDFDVGRDRSSGAWIACVACAEIIERRDHAGLVRHASVRVCKALGFGNPDTMDLTFFIETFDAFFLHRSGDRVCLP